MKLGIFIKDFQQLEDWELKIIDRIRQIDTLELTVLIKDGRRTENAKKNNFLGSPKSKTTLADKLLNNQISLEEKNRFKFRFSKRDAVLNYLGTIPSIYLMPERKEQIDCFDEEDFKRVKIYQLDLILKLEFGLIQGDIINAAKYGIWYLQHGDSATNKIGPLGLGEVVLNAPVIAATLARLTDQPTKGVILEKAFYRRYYSLTQNRFSIQRQSASIFIKNIKQQQRKNLKIGTELIDLEATNQQPSLSIILKYLGIHYWQELEGKLNRFLFRFFNIRNNCWTLFLGQGRFSNATLTELEPIALPKNEFWADPFLFVYKKETYVFFERYMYSQRRGKITCGKIKGDKLVEITDVLDLPYHLSYPFIFEEDNVIYMIPETCNNNRLEIYKCTNFPAQWELYTAAFEGQSIADTLYYKDEFNQRWLFLNKTSLGKDHNTELHIFKIDSLKLNQIEAHQQNPVMIDARSARNAGAIFQENGRTIRPSQNNSYGIYGYGLNLNQITKLSLEEYEEKIIKQIKPDFKKGLNAVHHLHQIDGQFVIDGAFKRY